MDRRSFLASCLAGSLSWAPAPTSLAGSRNAGPFRPVTPACWVGVGGAGIRALRSMEDVPMPGAVRVAIDRCPATLARSGASVRILLSDESVARTAISRDPRFAETIGSSDPVVVLAGLGGAFGSSAVPEVTALSQRHGALVIPAVCTPLAIEGSRRHRRASDALDRLHVSAPRVSTISLEDLLFAVPGDESLRTFFFRANLAMVAAAMNALARTRMTLGA